jgi:hypothetical protein
MEVEYHLLGFCFGARANYNQSVPAPSNLTLYLTQ